MPHRQGSASCGRYSIMGALSSEGQRLLWQIWRKNSSSGAVPRPGSPTSEEALGRGIISGHGDILRPSSGLLRDSCPHQGLASGSYPLSSLPGRHQWLSPMMGGAQGHPSLPAHVVSAALWCPEMHKKLVLQFLPCFVSHGLLYTVHDMQPHAAG